MPDFVQYGAATQTLADYKEQFQTQSKSLTDKPVSDRQCHDICCVVFFIVFFTSFIAYAAYSIRTMVTQSQFELVHNVEGTILNGITWDNLQTFVIIVVSCLAGAIIISLTLCAVIWWHPLQGVYVMAAGSTLAFLGLAIYLCVSVGNLQQFSTYFYVVVFVFAVTVGASKPYLQKSAILIKTTKSFIKNNVKIIMIVVINLIYCLVMLVIWCLGLYAFCNLYSQKILSYGGFVGSSIYWAFLLLFFNIYFYYTSIFLTSYSLAIWFYQKQSMDGFGTPFKHMVRYHLGSITFATLIISIVKFIKFFLFFGQFKNEEGPCGFIGSCFSCFVTCCVGALQPLFQVLNSYALITVALTGRSLIKSAKLIGHIAFEDFTTFSQFTFAGLIMRVGSVFFSSSIPTIAGTILINSKINNDFLTIAGSLLIMFTASIIGTVILQIFLQSIDVLFIMYRIDTQIMESGQNIYWTEQFGKELQKGFDQAFIGEIKKKPKPKYKNVTTIVVNPDGSTHVFQQKVEVPPVPEIYQDTMQNI